MPPNLSKCPKVAANQYSECTRARYDVITHRITTGGPSHDRPKRPVRFHPNAMRKFCGFMPKSYQKWPKSLRGGCCAPFGSSGSLSNTMWPETRPTFVPSGILIHPALWPQRHGTKRRKVFPVCWGGGVRRERLSPRNETP